MQDTKQEITKVVSLVKMTENVQTVSSRLKLELHQFVYVLFGEDLFFIIVQK